MPLSGSPPEATAAVIGPLVPLRSGQDSLRSVVTGSISLLVLMDYLLPVPNGPIATTLMRRV